MRGTEGNKDCSPKSKTVDRIFGRGIQNLGLRNLLSENKLFLLPLGSVARRDTFKVNGNRTRGDIYFAAHVVLIKNEQHRRVVEVDSINTGKYKIFIVT